MTPSGLGRLRGKTAIVTGAGTADGGVGNGKATALLFAREGAQVVCVDIDLKAAQETADQISGEGGLAISAHADVSNSDEVRSFVALCVDTFGSVDILHNNVGIAPPGGPIEQSEELWQRVIDVNLKSVFLTCKHVLPLMIDNGGGVILNVSSTAGLGWQGTPYIAYASSKAALLQFTRAVAAQHGPDNVRCNVLLPGLVDTPLVRAAVTQHAGEEYVESFMSARNAECPLGRQASPWDVANAALFLGSDEAAYITGASLIIDGGYSSCLGMNPQHPQR